MKRLCSFFIMGCLVGAFPPALAVQDPKVSAAQLDSRLSELQAELAKIDTKLASTPIQPGEKSTLLAKRRTLISERRELTEAKSRNARLQENPLVRFSGEGAQISEGERIDKIFSK